MDINEIKIGTKYLFTSNGWDNVAEAVKVQDGMVTFRDGRRQYTVASQMVHGEA